MSALQNLLDPHVDVWTNDVARYPVATGYKIEDMSPPTFFPEDILRHARPSGVDRIVLVQMSYYGTDNRYMLDTIAAAPQTFRGIAIVDPRGPDPDRAMAELKPRGVRGFRIVSFDGPPGTTPENWLGHPGFETMFRCAGRERMAICP